MATDPREVEAPERTHMTPGFANHFASKPRYGRMVEYVRADLHDALREKLEAAEAERDATHSKMELVQADLTEARAVQAAGYTSMQAEALSIARKAWEEADRSARPGLMCVREAIADLTPPADLSAALQRVRDEAWNEAIEAMEGVAMHPLTRKAIRALRRAPTEGEG